MNSRILLVEDDEFLREGLYELLTKEKYNVFAASSYKTAMQILKEKSFELLILDVMLPDGNGIDICAYLRKKSDNTPIMFLTACDDEIQIVRGLDAGGDDYVTKPFKLLEFLSRVRSLLRRNTAPYSYSSGNLSIDFTAMTVTKDGNKLFITPTEFQILSILIRNRNITVTRNTLLQNVWDCNGSFIDDNTLSVHISRLREKIGNAHISTVRGFGYRWED